ncbi:MAG: DNA adenine methylase, partial [Bdellovibrionales bacterium]|nr:DNA adenine methylase [Bdellovibrionales bacterium]
MNTQITLFDEKPTFKKSSSKSRLTKQPLKTQLLKWIGNKQRFAEEIISFFPETFNTFYEPFMGSGAVIATLAPVEGFGSDGFKSLAGIWEQLGKNPNTLIKWYKERWNFHQSGDPKEQYEKIKAKYNKRPNSADLLFLSRSCYGGVVRFRQADGYMSTPVGPHKPITPESFEKRVSL